MSIDAENISAGGSIHFNNQFHYHTHGDTSGPNDGEPTDLIPLFDTAKDFVNRYEVTPASSILERLEKEHGHRFTTHTWFRLYSLRGHCLALRGESEGAARCFLLAKQSEPDTEASADLEIMAHLLFGDFVKAYELASQARVRYPESARIASDWVRTIPVEIPFGKLELEIPSHLKRDPDVALSLAQAAARRDELTIAIAYAKIAVEKAPSSIDAKVVFASTTIGRIAAHQGETITELIRSDLEKASTMLQSCIDQVRLGANAGHVAILELDLSVAQRLLGNDDAANDAVRSAYNLAPHDEEVRLQWVAVLSRANKPNEAIQVLGLDIESETIQVQLAWAQAKAMRAHDGDYDDAIRILETSYSKIRDQHREFRASWISTLAKLYRCLNKFEVASSLLQSEEAKADLESLDRHILLAKNELNHGDKEKAASHAKDGLAITISVDRAAFMELAIVFEGVGDNALALAAWKRGITAQSRIDYVLHVMTLAMRQEDHAYVLSVGEELRRANVFDQTAVELELAVLDSVSTIRSLTLIQELIEVIPEGRLVRYLRMRRTHLGLKTHREDLIERDAARLPQLEEIREGNAENAIIAIRQADPNVAVAAAYALIRRYPESVHSYQAMIGAFGLGVPGAAPIIPDPISAGLGTAVLLKDVHGDHRTWYVLEDATDLKPSLNEIGPGSAIAKAVTSRVIGEEIEIDEAFGTRRRCTIEKVIHKWVFRFQQCLEQIPIKFPDQKLFKAFKIKEGQSPAESVNEILAILTQIQGNRPNALAAYHENAMVPLPLLAQGLHVALPFAMGQVASGRTGYLRCCTGTPEEFANVEKLLATASKIVIDQTVLGTMFLLAAHADVFLIERILDRPIEWIVAEMALEDFRAFREEVNDCRPRMGPAMVGGRMVPSIFTENDAVDMKSHLLPTIDALLRLFEKCCTVIQGSTLDSIPHELRDNCVHAFGRAGAESLEIAIARGAILWTDDMMYGHLAQGLSCGRAWTQSICRWIIFKDDAEAYRRLTLALLSLRYDFTSIAIPADVLAAGLEARWEVNRQPLLAVFDCFSRPTIDVNLVVGAALACLREVWTASVYGLQAQQVTRRILDRLGARPNGRNVVKSLRVQVHLIFGLHVIATENVLRIVDNWLCDDGHGKIIIP